MECYGPRILTRNLDVVEGYVLVEEGVVEEVAEGGPPMELDAEGVVAPGPVNGHTHLADGFLEAPPGLSVEELVGPGGFKHRGLAAASRREIVDSIEDGLLAGLAAGTTGFVDFRESGVAGVAAFREAAARVPVETVVLGRPGEDSPGDVVAEADGLGLSSVNDHPPEELEAAAEAAHRAGKPLAIHAAETREGQERSVRETGMGEIERALELEPDLLVHVTNPLDGELDMVEAADVPVVLCPRSNDRLCAGFPPVQELVERGVPLLLGTDNAMLVEPSVLAEARFLMEKLNKKGRYVKPVLRAAFHSGEALGIGTGMEKGGAARLVVLDDVLGHPVATVSGASDSDSGPGQEASNV